MQTLQTVEHTIEQTIHQRVEQLMRHRLALLAVLGFMGIAVLKFDANTNHIFQQAYAQGFGWIGTYMHHEHPTHGGLPYGISRVPTISGGP